MPNRSAAGIPEQRWLQSKAPGGYTEMPPSETPLIRALSPNGGPVRNLFAFVLLGTAVMAFPQTAPFTVALSATKSQIKAGEPVDLIVVMTNISDHEVDCTSNGSNALDRNYEYDVTDEKGQPVRKIEKEPHGGSSIWPCVIHPRQTALAAGGRISVLFDFSHPGKYTIQVSRGVWGDENRPGTFESSGYKYFVKSNTIAVTVFPK